MAYFILYFMYTHAYTGLYFLENKSDEITTRGKKIYIRIDIMFKKSVEKLILQKPHRCYKYGKRNTNSLKYILSEWNNK